MKDKVDILTRFGDYLRGGKPFGFLVPFLVIFFCIYVWKTGDVRTIKWLREVTWFLLGGGAVGAGVHLTKK